MKNGDNVLISSEVTYKSDSAIHANMMALTVSDVRPSALRSLYIIIIGVALLIAGCGGGDSVRHVPHLGNTPYQQDTILVTYATDPERALTLLDSALFLGNISEYRGQYIRAKIYGKSLEELRIDSAIIICEALLSHDSVRNEPTEQENILDLLIATARAKHDNEAYLRWAYLKRSFCASRMHWKRRVSIRSRRLLRHTPGIRIRHLRQRPISK